jgi:hypothetical protein
MKIKTLITIVLLVFVVGSFTYLLVDEGMIRSKPQSDIKDQGARAGSGGSELEKAFSDAKISHPDDKIIVYYFHGMARCSNCRKFEAYTQETIQRDFQDALSQGRLEWKIINVDEPANGHFINDYRLFTRTLVVAKMREGKQVEWKNLQRIWELVGNKDAFIDYVRTEVAAYLGENV